MSSLLIELITAISIAAVLFVIASGLTLIFGALRLVNLAHGSLYMYGAYGVTMLVRGGGPAGAFWLALLVVPLAVGALGFAIERLAMRRLYDRDHLAQLLATFALTYVLGDLALVFWGSNPRLVATPSPLSNPVLIAGRYFPAYYLFVIGVAVAVATVMAWVLNRTTAGLRVRAALDDQDLLAALGTNVGTVHLGVFVAGAALAGLAGAVAAPIGSVGPGMDVSILVDAFVVVVIGGLGSIRGAAIAALLVGIVRVLGITYAPGVSSVSVYALMIVVLVTRPQGLLGTAQ